VQKPRSIISRLTYANVVSSICLFILLGGSAYAAAKINGSQIKNRTVAGKKLKLNTVTGNEVDESKLGQVPSADSAVEAEGAQFAGNAQRLGGLDPSEFERSSRTQFARAFDSTTTKNVLFSWPELGVRVTTDGDADSNEQLRFANTRQSGNIIGRALPGGTAFGPAPGTDQEAGDGNLTDGKYEAYVLSVPDPSYVMHIECMRNPIGGAYTWWCFATRSKP
jgi:hypothetical protein